MLLNECFRKKVSESKKDHSSPISNVLSLRHQGRLERWSRDGRQPLHRFAEQKYFFPRKIGKHKIFTSK